MGHLVIVLWLGSVRWINPNLIGWRSPIFEEIMSEMELASAWNAQGKTPSTVLVAQLCLTLCNLMDCSPAGSSVRGIL